MQEEQNSDQGKNYLDIGWLEICLKVKDIKKSIDFYRQLDFEIAGGDPLEGWAVMENDAYRIALYQNQIEQNLLNFRGGDVRNIAETLKKRGLKLLADTEHEPDGSIGASVEDPDGNLIYFNTHPDELDDCCDEGKSDCCGGHQHH